MKQIVNAYYADNAKKLHHVVDKILLKFGGISNKDLDDFYSIANEVFVDVMRRYNYSQSFDGLLYTCLFNKIKTEITRRNREKRKADRMTISIDTPVADSEDVTIADIIADQCNIEAEVIERSEGGYGKKMSLYLSKLSKMQKKVLQLNADGYFPNEIREELRISEKEYADCHAAIHSYRNVSVLF